MLYIKPIRDINYQDIVNFCEAGHKEGFYLEYKKDFPPDNERIAKTIAAFANTYGGLLIIGVNAPDGKPVPPFEGINFDSTQKYEEKIQSIVLSHIREPVFPEIRVCDPVNGKTFIVIRVAESHLTPHRVSNNTKIYVRTGQSSTPNEEATWDKIEWLVSRRKKSEEFRELLISQSERYLREVCKLRGIDIDDKAHYFAVLSLRSIALFPQNPLVPYKELTNIEKDITTRRWGYPFPEKFFDPDLIENGVRKFSLFDVEKNKPAHGKVFEYVHLNTFGLYLYKRDIGKLNEEKTSGSEQTIKIKRMDFGWIVDLLINFLESAILFYKRLGYWGTLQITVQLKNGLGVRIAHPVKHEIFPDERDSEIPTDDLKWGKIVLFRFLQDKMIDVAVEMIHAIGWSLNFKNLSEDWIRKILDKTFGLK